MGMKQIFNELTQRFASYQRAYEACKQINVYTEGRTVNDPEVETVIEQVLQEVLKYVLVIVNKNRKLINKVIITGSGAMFANIDILFTEFLDMKSELLKPEFISDSRSIKNIAEVLESIEAVAMACGTLTAEQKSLNYVTKKDITKFSLSDLFSFGKKLKSKIPNMPKIVGENKSNEPNAPKQNVIISGFDISKIFPYTVSATIALGLILIGYIIFGNIYTNSINKILADISTKDSALTTKISDVTTDINYVNTNSSEYKSINTEVQGLVTQIESNQIGKLNTYNVANFLQKIIKIIPKNVQLKTISSDDNKKIKMSAQSTSYADLGYFVAQLKLEGVLNSVTVNSIQNGQTIVIEIGGELP
jgi:Tfp pilus assembly protein PilN